MTKRKSAFYFLLIAAIFSAFSIESFAQVEQSKQCSGEKFTLPQTITIDNAAFATYIRVMSLPGGERQKAFSELSNEEKARFFKINLSFNFVNRDNLNEEQKDLILETIQNTTPDIYNKQNPEVTARVAEQTRVLQQKALSIFTPPDAFEIFASLNGEKSNNIRLLQKYEEVLQIATISGRQEFIRNTTPANRSEIWRAQMVYHLATGSFKPEQLKFISDTIPFLNEKAFNLPNSEKQSRNEELENLKMLKSKASDFFTKEEAFGVFMSIGIQKPALPDTKPSDQQRPAMCNCNYWCGFTATCNGGDCIYTTQGCGWYGTEVCLFKCN